MSGVGPATADMRLTWIRRAVFAALIALAAWMVVRLLIALIAPSSLWEPIEVTSAPVQTASVARDYDFSTNPFNSDDAVDIKAPVVDAGEDAPETTLNLVLKGRRAGPNGSAFIRTPDNNEDQYYIDDEVMNGVILRGVFPDYVLIEVNGQTQRLTLEDVKLAQRNASRSGQNTDTGRSLSTLRATDATDLLSQVRLIPAFDEEMNRTGLEVSARSAGVDLADYGLQDGDVLTSIAGVSLTSGLPDIADLRRRIRPGQPIRVTLLRDGAPVTLTVGSPS